ncbi:MAG: protein-glutamate O-methyltransferase [Armatimonadota bacterium]
MELTTIENENRTELMSLELTQAQFERISSVVYKLCRINLHLGKEVLVKARLAKRLRLLGMSNFEEYMDYLERDKSGKELSIMIDSLTTNKTSFFRESQHFEYLQRHLLPSLKAESNRIRIWSAGCSSGEEPYTLSVVIRETFPDVDRMDVRILATDISSKVLDTAKEALYNKDTLKDVPPDMVRKYFTCTQTKPMRIYKVNDNARSMIRFARLNLMDQWPMSGPFDVIFCRNVMIYFDKPTQQELVRRYWEMLRPGGHLFVGHSESLTATSHQFKYVQPAVYIK